MDLMSICGALVEANGLISVPHFYDKVRPISHSDLERVWQQPSLSVRHMPSKPESLRNFAWMRSVSLCESAILSLRFVPDQSAEAVFHQIKSAIDFQFARRRSPNVPKVRKIQSWEWWEA